MERSLWERSFEKGHYPEYPCPRCGTGRLKLPPKDHLIREPYCKVPEGVNNYLSGVGESSNFAAILRCSKKECLQTVSMIGEFIEDYEDYDEESQGPGRFNSYFPKYFFPNLKIFNYPSSVPSQIQEEINRSFSNFFADPQGAANKIRRVIELMVSELGAPKFTWKTRKCSTSQKREKHYFDLHTRIVKLKKSKKRTSEMLLGLKVIGNDGSHANESTIYHDDILEAYEVLEFLLGKEFSRKEDEILKTAKKLQNRN